MRTTTRLVAAAATTVLLMSGCSGSDGDAADGRITLRFQSLAWQDESVAVNKELVKEWNAAHPDVRVEYVQGSWDSVHDQLLTSFEGGEAPDIIHDASDDLADFAYGGYLADLDGLLPDRLKRDIPEQSWRTTKFGDGVYGVPFLQEPRVLIANKKILEAFGVRIPTVEQPWTWAEFRSA
ncbi:ABC transporter substrate-binding protein, partial [Streptomyces niveus]